MQLFYYPHTEKILEIFNLIEHNISLLDSDLNVLWANRAYCERLGMNEDDVLGKKCYFLWHRRSSPCENCPCVKALQSGNIESNERESAEGRIYLLTGIPLKEGNKIVGVFEIGKEITKEKMLQSRVKEIIKHEAFFEIIDDILHHFKNIFTGVYGYAQLLKDKIKDETALCYINRLMESVERGNKFLHAMSYLKKEPSGQIVFDMNYLIISIKEVIQEIAGDRIEIQYSFTKDIPLILGDPLLIKEVIIELVENAKNSIVDGGLIKISTEIVQEDSAEKICLIVADTGKGMDEVSLNRCFEPLFTTNPSRFGLGLSMVKNIIYQHKGTIKIQSIVQQGTTVKVYFPKAISQQAQGT
ncbi:two-component system sensor histidine kinase NtrB [Thermodesulfovibrio hydrogeniphilus]